ncbi:HupE/UreJ family protein [Jannaschia sp. S6380]|uniref:HupE/UreJ family protein n=1 Tax=Jannaschia sp. S6380 TaxID=2926408 RepID=UPI001FF670EF|nr:HupE/UreJ family protein [Jannaschia sp. S6380]MCK0168356.1 HupE/UreJ family protein [Jannaschia sp. S6380]
MTLLRLAIRVGLGALLSIVFAITASAHEVQPSVADVTIDGNRVTITLTTAMEPIVAGVNLSEVADTDESPLSDRNDALRALSPDEMGAALMEAWPGIAERITLRVGDMDLVPELAEMEIPPVGDPEIRRDSTLTLTAELPEGDEPVIFGWDSELGGLIVRQVSDGEGYDAYLTNGALTEPMPRIGVAEMTLGEAVMRYVVSGFDHIIPKGLDHILFVLGLFFYSLAFRPLIWQISAFTVAHTVTLALATMGIVQPTMWIVEALIALSIVWVAVENIWAGGKQEIGWTRIAVVFGFGLLHGLGFASVLSEFGLGQHFIASLISFNIGVEIGQLTVIAVAFLLLGLPFGSKPWYRRAIAIPGSLIIALIAAYWVLNRIGFAGDLPYLT